MSSGRCLSVRDKRWNSIFPTRRIGSNNLLILEFLELIVAHASQIVVVAKRFVAGEAVAGEEALFHIVARLDVRGQLSHYKNRCAVDDMSPALVERSVSPELSTA